jgi:uncharacterized membrane protein YbhN (UPF0104 family)
MQSMLQNKNIKLIINYVLGPLVFILLSLSIYKQVQRQPGWEKSLDQLLNIHKDPESWLLIVAFALVFVNWGIEARKWQVAIRRIQAISFIKAFKAIFTGTTLASFTPNRTGEYVGRILYIDEGKRIQAIALTILCSMAQLQITFYAGLIALWTMQNSASEFFSSDSIYFSIGLRLFFVVISIVAVLLTLFYFRMGWLLKQLHTRKWAAKWIKYAQAVESLEATILLRMLSLSLFRYLIFVVQYYLVFMVFDVQVNWWQCLQIVSVLFLLLAVIPSFTFLTDLGIRWKAGIEIVRLYSTNALGIFASAFTIWLFNLIIPALIGSLLILGIRIFKNKEA